MTEKTVLRIELGAEAKGKQFIVMNNADSDFPKGTVVTCMDKYGEKFNSESETDTFMCSDVLLKPVDSTLTFTELAAKLPELEVGTEFKTDYGSILYVGTQHTPPSDNKFLYWKSSDKPVGVSEVTVGATYTEIQKESAKPEFTEIDWKEAFQIVADGGIVYADDDKIAVSKYTDFGDINSGSVDYIADDFDDLLNDTNWFKKTE
ncbi:hypothetical protein [uncultured Vagococcus sp.]|uniref:hypothetical protein n=1 Tax=uncultured Vagococcus sp. TaxID=189676 RepID=UPI0025899F79|nr:hypothetical protein [uncultured Vagococcus sp.]